MQSDYRLSTEERNDMIRSIQAYFLAEKGEELGDLAAGLLLDFFIKEFASVFYNKGVEDAHTFLSEKLDDVFEIQR